MHLAKGRKEEEADRGNQRRELSVDYRSSRNEDRTCTVTKGVHVRCPTCVQRDKLDYGRYATWTTSRKVLPPGARRGCNPGRIMDATRRRRILKA